MQGHRGRIGAVNAQGAQVHRSRAFETPADARRLRPAHRDAHQPPELLRDFRSKNVALDGALTRRANPFRELLLMLFNGLLRAGGLQAMDGRLRVFVYFHIIRNAAIEFLEDGGIRIHHLRLLGSRQWQTGQ